VKIRSQRNQCRRSGVASSNSRTRTLLPPCAPSARLNAALIRPTNNGSRNRFAVFLRQILKRAQRPFVQNRFVAAQAGAIDFGFHIVARRLLRYRRLGGPNVALEIGKLAGGVIHLLQADQALHPRQDRVSHLLCHSAQGRPNASRRSSRYISPLDNLLTLNRSPPLKGPRNTLDSEFHGRCPSTRLR